jgi:hypothetical protein
LLTQQTSITVYRLPTKENKLLYAANKQKFAVSIFRKQMEVAVFRLRCAIKMASERDSFTKFKPYQKNLYEMYLVLSPNLVILSI